MIIERIDIVVSRVPLLKPFKTSRSLITEQASVVALMHTSDGIIGLGEVNPSPNYSKETLDGVVASLRDVVIPAVIGLNAFNIVELIRAMDLATPGHLEAKAAVEIAAYDAGAKAMKQPIHRLLGGTSKQEIPVIGWVGIKNPENDAQEALDWIKRGFKTLKVKVGSGVEADAVRLQVIRETVGYDVPIRVDANEAYDVDTAIEAIRKLEPYNLVLCEQPVRRDDFDGLARVRRNVGVPIMADEGVLTPEDVVTIIKKEAADYIKFKIMKQGGIYNTMKALAVASAGGIPCVIGHGFGMAMHTLAELHIAAASDNILYPGEMVGPLKLKDDIVREPLCLEGGVARVSMAPGLGAELDQEKAARYKVRAFSKSWKCIQDC